MYQFLHHYFSGQGQFHALGERVHAPLSMGFGVDLKFFQSICFDDQTLPHLLQHKVCFYKAAQLLFHEIHPWTVQLKSTCQDEAKLIQKHLFIAASTPWNTCDIASPPGQGSKKYRKTLISKPQFSYFLCLTPSFYSSAFESILIPLLKTNLMWPPWRNYLTFLK